MPNSSLLIRVLSTVFVLAVVGCGGKDTGTSPTPSGPTTPASGMQISNVNVRPLGLRNTVCSVGSPGDYKTVDEITMDFRVGAGNLLGARLVNHLGTPYIPIASAITSCSMADPCSSLDQACVVKGAPTSSGSLKAYVVADWTPTFDWRLAIQAALNVRSNEFAVPITRTEGLPYGNRAGVVAVRMTRCVSTTGQPPPGSCASPPQFGESYALSIFVYNPHLPNRTVSMKFEVYNSQGRLIKTISATPQNESSGQDASLAAFTSLDPEYEGISSFSYRFVGSMREFEGTTLLGEDSKETTVQRQ
jgi:hypothetical protein